MNLLEIVTPRLVLRPPCEADAEEITRAKQQAWPELQLWMSWAYAGQETREATLAFIDNYPGALVACERESGEIAVMSGLDPAGDGGSDAYSTGYWAAIQHRGKGYATEAANAIIRYAFGAKDAKAIHIDYYEGNEKSRRVIEKLGFTCTHTEKEGHNRCLDGAPLDVHCFVMRDPAVLPPLEVSWKEQRA